jgi:hypothetical protein
VGGVINFIMKKKFEGLQFDAQGGESQRGDAFEYQFGGIMGSNFADNLLHRDNIFTRGNYEINDWVSFVAQGMFS